MLELWGIRRTPPLPSLPGPLWPGVVAPDKVLFIRQIGLTFKLSANKWLMLNWFVKNRTVSKQIELFHLTFLTCVYESYLSNIYMYTPDLALNKQQCLICRKTKSNQILYSRYSHHILNTSVWLPKIIFFTISFSYFRFLVKFWDSPENQAKP